MKSKVYFVSDNNRFDISSSLEWGETRYVFRNDKSLPFANDFDSWFYRSMQALEQQDSFNPFRDYLALTGPTVAVAAFAAAATHLFISVRFLAFDARTGAYDVIEFQHND